MRNKFFPAFIFMSVPLFIKAQTDSLLNLLGLSLEDIMNVKVVTAYGYMQKTKEVPSTILVITEKQIAEKGYEQLGAFRNIPGTDMIHLNGYGKDW